MVLKESSGPGGPVYVLDNDREVSIFGLLRPLVRYRRVIAVSAVAFAALAVAHTRSQSPTYTSRAMFIPQGEETRTPSISGLAARFGVSVGSEDPGKSPRFFADLLTTQPILRSTVETSYEVPGRDGSEPVQGDLISLWANQGGDPARRLQRAINRLRNGLRIRVAQETGIVSVSIATSSPHLSAAIGARMLELLNEFNLNTQRSRAEMERTFIENQKERVRQDLLAAEDSLGRFLEENRRFESSPRLAFEMERLNRQVRLHEQLYTSLAEAYQTTSIEAVRDTPIITVVDPPLPPVQADPRRTRLKIVMALILGTMVGCGMAYGRSFLERTDEEDEEYAEFIEDLREATEGPRATLQRIRGALLAGRSKRSSEAE